MTLLLLLALLAQAAPPPKVEMVVTVEREAQPRDDAAAAVTVLTSEDIEKLPAASLDEALAVVPGLTMLSAGTPMITARGFFGGGEVEYIKLLVDGVPAGDVESGNADWSRFRLDGIDRIEVVQGPGSAMYGDAALGGVIQLFTKRPAENGGDVRATVGSFGTRAIEGGYHADLGVARLTARGEWSDLNGYREQNDRNDTTAFLGLDRLGDRSRWQLSGSHTRTTRRNPGPLVVGSPDRTASDDPFRFDREHINRDRLSLGYDRFGDTTIRGNAWLGRRDSDNLRSLLLAPGFATSAHRDLATNTSGVMLDASRKLLGGELHAGADFSYDTADAIYRNVGDDGALREIAASGDGSRASRGVFLTGAWDVCARCRLTAGIRHDSLRSEFAGASSDASATSPRVGFTYRTGANATLFAQLSHAFKAPTIDQLFDARPYPDFAGGTFTISNPDLQPLRARNAEIGASGGQSLRWSVAAYHMSVRDEIDFDPQTFTYRNIGRSLHRGVETSVALRSDARISPTLTYAWTSVADSEEPSRQLKNIPEHVAQAIVQARLPRHFHASLVYRWMSGLWLDDDNVFAQPDISRVDLRFSRTFTRARIDLDVTNALDERYADVGFILADFTGRPVALEYPAAGRAVRLAMSWRF